MHGQVWAIVVAGGVGARAGRTGGKQLAAVAGKPVVAWALEAIAASAVDGIVLVCPPNDRERCVALVAQTLGDTPPVIIAGSGATRRDSVASGLREVPAACEVIVVHDGARPLVTPAIIDEALSVLRSSEEADGVVVGHPSVDSLKRVTDGWITGSVDRASVWTVQTPQVFRARALRQAHESAIVDSADTDDAALVERMGGRLLLLEGPRDNMKVTLPEDFVFVESVLEARSEEG